MTDYDVDVRGEPPVAVLVLTGRIDSEAMTPLNHAYEQAVADDTQVVLLDFHAVDYINSTGIALIVGVLGRARAEGRRVKEQRAAGAAYAAIRDRGTAVKDLSRKAGVPEKVIRDCIAAHESSGPAEATPKASGAGQAGPAAVGEATAQPSELTREQLAG